MSLAPGTRIGPYEIVSALGAGGMGEVYRARDPRLNRTVAIKVLLPHFASEPDSKQRFDREARAIAALSHPHICPVFDVGHQDGTGFLVMEYLDGETLAQRLARGKLPVDQTFRYAIEITDALAAAHKGGVVHRDLKPSNVLVTSSGAKLLDFGLARIGGAATQHTATHIAQKPLTAAGTRAEQPLLQLKATLEAELATAERERPTPTTRNLPFELRQAIQHLHDGVSANEVDVEGVVQRRKATLRTSSRDACASRPNPRSVSRGVTSPEGQYRQATIPRPALVRRASRGAETLS